MFSYCSNKHFLLAALLAVLLLPAGCDSCSQRIPVPKHPSEELRREKKNLEEQLSVSQVGAHHAFARQLGRVSLPLDSGGLHICTSDDLGRLDSTKLLSWTFFNKFLGKRLYKEGICVVESQQVDGALMAFLYSPLFEPLFSSAMPDEGKYLALYRLILACTEALRHWAEHLKDGQEYEHGKVDQILDEYKKRLAAVPELIIQYNNTFKKSQVMKTRVTVNYYEDPKVQEAWKAYRLAVKKIQSDYEKVMGIDNPQVAQ